MINDLTANPILKKYLDQEFPLHAAIKNGNIEAMQLLIEKGANIEARGILEYTPLHIVIAYNNIKAIRLLIEKGANIEAKSKSGHTPLHNAAEDGNIETMQLLIEKGANIEAKDSSGRTPLYYAVEKCYAKTLKLLVANGAKIEGVDFSNIKSKENGITDKLNKLAGAYKELRIPQATSNYLKILKNHDITALSLTSKSNSESREEQTNIFKSLPTPIINNIFSFLLDEKDRKSISENLDLTIDRIRKVKKHNIVIDKIEVTSDKLKSLELELGEDKKYLEIPKKKAAFNYLMTCSDKEFDVFVKSGTKVIDLSSKENTKWQTKVSQQEKSADIAR